MSRKGNHQYGKPKSSKMMEAVKAANSRQVMINGIAYSRLMEASNISKSTLSYKLNSENLPNYKRLQTIIKPNDYRKHS